MPLRSSLDAVCETMGIWALDNTLIALRARALKGQPITPTIVLSFCTACTIWLVTVFICSATTPESVAVLPEFAINKRTSTPPSWHHCSRYIPSVPHRHPAGCHGQHQHLLL